MILKLVSTSAFADLCECRVAFFKLYNIFIIVPRLGAKVHLKLHNFFIHHFILLAYSVWWCVGSQYCHG